MRATLIFIIIIIVVAHRSLDLDLDLVCGVLHKKSLLIQRLKAKCKTRKTTRICHRCREHEERKAGSMLPSFFIGHTDKESVGESSERLFFSIHINKGLVARLGGRVEMFEMVTSG